MNVPKIVLDSSSGYRLKSNNLSLFALSINTKDF